MPFTYGQRRLSDFIGNTSDHRGPINYNQPNETFKLQYSNNLNSTTYITTKFYRVNSVSLFDFPYDSTNTVFFGDLVALQGGQRAGIALDGTKQLGSKNLLGFGAKYDFLRPVYSQPSATTAMVAFNGYGSGLEGADFFSPTTCPANYTNIGVACGYITNFMTPYLVNGQPDCGAAATPAQRTQLCPRAVQLPYSDESTHSLRQDWAFYIKDTFSP